MKCGAANHPWDISGSFALSVMRSDIMDGTIKTWTQTETNILISIKVGWVLPPEWGRAYKINKMKSEHTDTARLIYVIP